MKDFHFDEESFMMGVGFAYLVLILSLGITGKQVCG